MQRGLLGTITPKLRAAMLDINKYRSLFYIRFYYDGEVSEGTVELWNCACTEAIAGLWSNFFPDEIIEQLDYPPLVLFSGRYAYLRKEGEIKHIISHFLSRKFIHPVTEEIILTTTGILHDAENGNITIPTKPEGISSEREPVIAYALIAVQRALLGVVIPELRSVIIDAT